MCEDELQKGQKSLVPLEVDRGHIGMFTRTLEDAIANAMYLAKLPAGHMVKVTAFFVEIESIGNPIEGFAFPSEKPRDKTG